MTDTVDTSAAKMEATLKLLAEVIEEGAGPLATDCERLINGLAAERDEIAASRKALDDALTEATRSFIAERDALAAFKAYTHQRLDEAGISTHPKGRHSAEGCRVGDRFDLLIAQRDTALMRSEAEAEIANELKAERDALSAEVARLREALRSISETRWDMATPEACLVMAMTLANAAITTNAKGPTP